MRMRRRGIWPAAAVLGQGAGIAAALSVKSGKALADLVVADIQRELERQGGRHH